MKINSNKLKSLILLSLVGSASTNEEKPTNQSELTLNSLPEIGTNLTKQGDDSDPTFVFGGYPVLMMDDLNRENIKNCTISFFTLYRNSSDCDYGDSFPIGIITSSLCSPVAGGEDNIVRVWTRDKSLHLGDVIYMTFGEYNEITNFDYALTSIFNIFTDRNEFLSYTAGLTNNDKTVSELYPVIGTSLPQLGIICAYGSGSGYRCGSQVGSDLEITIPSPWKSGSTITFKGLNKVDMGKNGFESEEDRGGPVYSVGSSVDKKTVINALGHITWLNNTDPNHKLVYYTPTDKVLSAILENNKCSYSLLTYNETNNKEFQAQVEAPPKK